MNTELSKQNMLLDETDSANSFANVGINIDCL